MPGFKDWLRKIVCAEMATGLLVCIVATLCSHASGQTARDRNQSERSDKLTGGHIARGEFQPGEPDLRLTLNVPSFRLTLWQNGREVKSYFVGVGMKNYPIYIGDREATEVIWNPPWIPPASDWVEASSKVRAGEIIKASDPRNPLGKLKIPLGDSYLIHQAAKPSDLGNLVSHGCVRMLRSDLYDLAARIIATRDTGISRKRIEAAKRNSKTLTVPLNEPVPVDINYDSIVIEGRVLHIYPDVYDRGTNTVAQVIEELKSENVDVTRLDRSTIQQMLSSVTPRAEFVVKVESIEQGSALRDGQVLPLIPPAQKTKSKRKR
jgi:murein L,D-transpeptidase YcbB/YkuD